VVLTPHMATLTVESRSAMETKAAANVLDWLETQRTATAE